MRGLAKQGSTIVSDDGIGGTVGQGKRRLRLGSAGLGAVCTSEEPPTLLELAPFARVCIRAGRDVVGVGGRWWPPTPSSRPGECHKCH